MSSSAAATSKHETAGTHKDDVVRYFGRHFVSLTCLHELVDEKKRPDAGHFSVSGFVISVHGHWFWVTAGHVIDEVEENILTRNREIVQCGLIDSWSVNSAYFDRVPIDFEEVRRGRIDKQFEIDCAVVYLGRNCQSCLEQNGVTPLEETAWRNSPGPEAVDSYLLMGIPNELQPKFDANDVYRRRIDVLETVTLHHVEPVMEPPANAQSRPFPHIYGRIHLRGPIELSDIKGMSGGPLFAMKTLDNGETRYWVAGIQSSWLNQSRIIVATPIEPIARAIEERISEFVAD